MPATTRKHGGARPKSGPKTAPQDLKAAATLGSQLQFEGLFRDVPPARLKALEAALWDRACGLSEMVRVKLRGRAAPEAIELCTDVCKTCGQPLPGTETETRYLYSVAPDPRAQELLLAHGMGRPNVKADTPMRPVFVIKHSVPGWQEKRYEVNPLPTEDGESPEDFLGDTAGTESESEDGAADHGEPEQAG